MNGNDTRKPFDGDGIMPASNVTEDCRGNVVRTSAGQRPGQFVGRIVTIRVFDSLTEL